MEGGVYPGWERSYVRDVSNTLEQQLLVRLMVSFFPFLLGVLYAQFKAFTIISFTRTENFTDPECQPILHDHARPAKFTQS